MIKSALFKSSSVIAASLVIGATAFAQPANTVYDNSTTYLGSYTRPGTGYVELGDEVTLGGTERLLSSFQFEYYLSAASGNEVAHAYLRALDGPTVGGNASPGSVLWESGSVALTAGYHTINATGIGGVTLPNRVAWTVAFEGVDGTEQAGLLNYNPPTIGSSFDDFWRKTSGGTWELAGDSSVADNFGARITAVPEPGTWALLLGGLTWLGFLGYRRKA